MAWLGSLTRPLPAMRRRSICQGRHTDGGRRSCPPATRSMIAVPEICWRGLSMDYNWLTPKPRGASQREGLGSFAVEPVAAGETVATFGGWVYQGTLGGLARTARAGPSGGHRPHLVRMRRPRRCSTVAQLRAPRPDHRRQATSRQVVCFDATRCVTPAATTSSAACAENRPAAPSSPPPTGATGDSGEVRRLVFAYRRAGSRHVLRNPDR